MTVSQADITWAKGQCTNIRQWTLRAPIRVQNDSLPGSPIAYATTRKYRDRRT